MIVNQKLLGPKSWREVPAFWWEGVKFWWEIKTKTKGNFE
jgi:hypothetical protein